MMDATNAIAMIRPDGFQRLVSRMEKNEPIFYASRQKRLVGLVGGGQASMLAGESGPAAGASKPVGEWIEKAKARLDARTVKELHGRLLILALARVDEDLNRYLQRGDFLQKVESELREPVDRLFLVSGDAAPLHVDSLEKEDRLGREAFARSLAARLRRIWQDYSQEAESSFILHLHGPWGAGKTTLLRLLRKELAPETDVVRKDKKTALQELLRKVLRRETNVARPDESRWIVVEFNAWRHQWLDPPWWSLLNSVYLESLRSLREEGGWLRACRHRLRESGRRLLAGRTDLLLAVQKAYWEFLLGSAGSEPGGQEGLLSQERERLQDADTQEKVFARMREDEPDSNKRQVRLEAAVEQLGTAQVEESTEYFRSPFAPLLDPNPRAMKRFVNAYALQRDLALLGGLDIMETVKRKQLALWTIVSLRWPLVEEYLIELACGQASKPSPNMVTLLNSESLQRWC